MEAFQIDHGRTLVWFRVVFDELGTAFKVINNARLTQQRHPFRLPVFIGRSQKLAAATGLNDVARHYAAALDVVAGLMASKVSLED